MLVRKINKSNWINKDTVTEPASADAITNCLRTKQNELSVWHINDKTKLEEAVLAIISGSKQEHLETIDVVMLDDDHLSKCKILTKETDGDTIVKDLKNTHIDIHSLNVSSITMIAEHIIENIKKENCQRFTEPKLKKLLKDAIDKKRLELTDLPANMQKKIS
jgi:hypothetical protein